MTQIRFFGLQRSGNHAIIGWISKNLSNSNSLFLNSCAPGDPFASFSQIEEGGSKFKRSHLSETDISDLSARRDDFDHIMVSYENVPHPLFQPSIRPRKFTMGFDQVSTMKTLLIWRSFPNWLASQYKRTYVDMPKEQRSLLKISKLIAQYADNAKLIAERKVADAFYDHWLRDEEYRESILKSLGLETINNDLGKTSTYGGDLHSLGDQKNLNLMRW
jgi:hypothetical protein